MRALPSRILFVACATHAEDVAQLAASAALGGVTFVEIRRKPPMGSAARLAEIRRALRAAPGTTILVNDRVDLAVLAGAHGAHVGQDDLPAGDARRLLGPDAWLGVSTHDEAQLEAAQALPADYVALGPIFASATKSGHAEPLGLQRLAACRRASDKPLVAIGGITLDRVGAVLAAGADAVAIAGAIASGDVEANARRALREAGER
jgi:thiamine-phosphate pyrophosphorylase